MTDLSPSREKDKINPVVFYTSAGLILLFSLMTLFFSDFSAAWIGRTPELGFPHLWLVLFARRDALYRVCRVHRLLAFRFGEARAGTFEAGV